MSRESLLPIPGCLFINFIIFILTEINAVVKLSFGIHKASADTVGIKYGI